MNVEIHLPTSKLARLEHAERRQTIVAELGSASSAETSMSRNKPDIYTKFPSFPYPFINAVQQSIFLLRGISSNNSLAFSTSPQETYPEIIEFQETSSLSNISSHTFRA
jgi:hypothetical protein